MLWIVKLVLLGIFVDQTLCCSCYRPHIQNAFCNSDVVIRGRPIKRYFAEDVNKDNNKGNGDNPVFVEPLRPWERELLYDVEVLEVFKAPTDSNIKKGNVTQAVTGGDPGMCGGSLWVDTEILITGGLGDQGRVGFGSCSYQEQFARLTSFQLENLRASSYDCDCNVKNYYRWNDETGNKDCVMSYGDRCYYKYGRCKSTEGRCQWDEESIESCRIPALP